jgi:hypothetical protein
MSRFNSLKLGFVLGLICPVIALTGFYFTRYSSVPIQEFISYALSMNVLSKLLSLCLLPNLLVFFVFIWQDFLFSARGVLIATFVVGFLIVVVKYAI